MRLPLLCSLIASTSLTAACGGASGPKTSKELGDRVLAALVAKDWNAMKGLYLTPDVALSVCSEMPAEKREGMAKEFASELADAEKDFKKCLEIDWTGAKVTELTGGEPKKKEIEGCGGKVVGTSDVELKLDVGGKVLMVKVNDPMLVEGGFALVEGIRCKVPELSCDDIYDNMTRIVGAASDARESEKGMFSGAADKKAEFGKMCGEMRSSGNPKLTTILTCVGEAKDYAAMKACEDQAKAGDSEDPGEPPKVEPVVAVEPAAPAEGGAAAPVVGDSCAKYFAKFAECADAMPEMQRGPMKQGLEQMKTALAGRPAEQTKTTCDAAMTAAKQSLATLCPAVSWD